VPSKITIVPLYWLLFAAEASAVVWMGRRAQFETGHGVGDGPVLVALAITMSLLLAVDAAVFHFIEDRRVRQVAFGALLVPTVLPAARLLGS
jgi:hypothetical protein